MSIVPIVDDALKRIQADNKPKIRTDIIELVSSCKSLTPKVDKLTHYDGRETQNIKATGTIPMFYQGVQYNVPLDIFVSDRHPMLPPSVFVRPTANMMIKSNHRFVENDGHVQTHYLTAWKPHIKLTELVQSLSAYFSEEPPLFSRPAGQVYQNGANVTSVSRPFNQNGRPPSGPNYTNPTTAINPTPGTIVSIGPSVSSSSSSSNNNNNNKSTTTLASPLIGSTSTATVGSNFKNKREKLESDLSSKLQSELRNLYQKLGNEIEEERQKQRELQQSNHATVECGQVFEQLRTKYTAAMREVEAKTEELKQWAEAQSRRDPDDMDAVLEPFDHISSQLVRLSAEQHAAEDLIDCLEKALLNGAIDLPTMLKETRRLASQQFLARMHVMKINASLQMALQNGH